MAKPIVTLEERFMSHVEPEPSSGCWLWTGAVDRYGYGRLKVVSDIDDRRVVARAHRIAWVIRFGSIPVGLCVLHHCDNPPCVNPDHLFLGTQGDNSRDKARKGRGLKSKKGLPFGVRFDRRSGFYQAHMRVDGRLKHLGTYSTIEKASAVAVAFKEQLLSTKGLK